MKILALPRFIGAAAFALTLSAQAQFQTVVVESRQPDGSVTLNPPYFEVVGNWQNSTGKTSVAGLSGSGSRFAFTNAPAVKITPTLTVPGGTYAVEVTQTAINASPSLLVDITQNGCSGLPATTVAFERTNGGNWKWIGNLTLYPDVTQPDITFSFSSGTLASNNRFYFDAIRFVHQEELIIESRASNGATNNDGSYVELVGNWQNSTAKSSAAGLKGGGSRFASTNSPAFKVVPALLQPGGVYSVEITHSGPASQSADVIASISQVGCSGLPSTTTALQRSGANTWKSVGTMTLNPGVTTPEITFTYSSGTLNTTNGRFYMDAIRFLRLDISPAITRQPQSQTVLAGNSATFTAQASGAPVLAFQWRFNGTNIPGATQSAFTIANVQPGNAGNYSVTIGNAWGNTTSLEAILTVPPPPTISVQPQSQTINPGDTVAFVVGATGNSPLGYQWRFNNAEIAGATDSSFTIFNAQAADAGNYSVVVSNSAGSVVSSNAVLSFIGAPSITTTPQNQTAYLGDTVSFSVTASGAQPLTYQWRRNGANLIDNTNIFGATTPTLTVSSVMISDGGTYSIIVSNTAGTATANARLRLASTNSIVVVESELPGVNQINTAPPYEEIAGTWLFSTLKSPAPGTTQSIGSRFGTTTNAAFKITPALQADKSYVVQITHGGAASVSSNIVVSITQSNCFGLPSTTTAFNRATANIWETIGTLTTLPGEPMPEITFTHVGGNPTRFYADAIRFVDANEPCLSALPEITDVTGPLVNGQTYVNVPGVDATAAKINVYADGVLIGEKTNGITAGLNVVATSPLARNQQITATQTDSNGIESCRSGTGEFVGGGANPRLRVSLSIRMDTTLTGPIGANAGPATTAPLMMLGGTRPVNGFGTAPLGGRVLEPSACWQTVEFLRGPDPTNSVDPTYGWFTGAGTNLILGDFGVLDAIALSIDDLTDTGPFEVYIDNLKNGDTVIQDFESATVGATEVTFKKPAYAATTTPFLISGRASDTSPNTAAVTDLNADLSGKSLFVNWQFGSTNASGWLRLAAHGNTAGFPMVDLRQPISFRILLLPVGQAAGSSVQITSSPQSATKAMGDSVTFSVGAVGSSALSYQWKFNGGDISGANGSALTLSNLQTNQSGNYSVAVQNAGGCSASAMASLAVYEPPTITRQPVGGTVNRGDTFTLSVEATGSGPLSYQWFRYGRAIPRATNSTLTLRNFQPWMAAPYFVEVSNSFSSTVSSQIDLKMRRLSGTVVSGRDEFLPRDLTNVITAVESPFSPQKRSWALRKDGRIVTWLPGDAISTPTGFTNIISLSGGFQNVVMLTEDHQVIWVNDEVTQNELPSYVTNVVQVVAFGSGGLAVRADGSGTAWGVPDVAAVNARLQELTKAVMITFYDDSLFAAVTDDGSVWVNNEFYRPVPPLTNVVSVADWCPFGALHENGSVVRFDFIDQLNTNAYHHVISIDRGIAVRRDYTSPDVSQYTNIVSTEGFLVVAQPPIILSGPLSQSANRWNTNARFHVTATGSDLLYQWRLNGSDIPGATNAILMLPIVDTASVGTYDVIVYNDFGTVVSSPATLTLDVGIDLNGDLNSDILFQSTNSTIAAWFMDATNRLGVGATSRQPAVGWKLVGSGDFDRDNKTDLLWQNGNGLLALWLLDGTNFSSVVPLNGGQPVSLAWQFAGVTDFNADSKPDLLWQNTNGQTAVWFMDGTNRIGSTLLRNGQRAGDGWKLKTLADLNDDNRKDFVWQHANGLLATWFMSGTNFLAGSSLNNGQSVGPGWGLEGSADFNHDGRSDLLFQHANGLVAVWFMNGTNHVGTALLNGGKPVAPGWKIVGPK